MKGEQQVKRAAEEVGAATAKEKMQGFKTALNRATRKGASTKEALGLTDAMVEGIYGQAYRLYNTGKYKEAIKIFRLLLTINATEPKYAMGMAACFHMSKDYKSAIDSYSIASIIDANSPIPLYHASDCYIKMGDPVSAIIMLETAKKRAGDKPEYKTLKDRANMTLESLNKEVAEREKK